MTFVNQNFKIVITCIVFLGTLYLNNQINSNKIQYLESAHMELKQHVNTQVQILEQKKLDTAVYEATMRSINETLKEIKSDLKHLTNERYK